MQISIFWGNMLHNHFVYVCTQSSLAYIYTRMHRYIIHNYIYLHAHANIDTIQTHNKFWKYIENENIVSDTCVWCVQHDATLCL